MTYKQYLVVRQDLQLPKGKAAAQCAHAAVEAALRSDKELVKRWRNEGTVTSCSCACFATSPWTRRLKVIVTRSPSASASRRSRRRLFRFRSRSPASKWYASSVPSNDFSAPIVSSRRAIAVASTSRTFDSISMQSVPSLRL